MENEAPTPRSEQSFGSFILELLRSVIIVALLVFVIRGYIIQPFVVDGLSMFPRFTTNDYLLVDKLSYHVGTPRRGDIVVFKYPGNTSVNYVKRMIGLPGDTVTIQEDGVFVSNSAHPTPVKLNESAYLSASVKTTLLDGETQRTVIVPDYQYFVLGDNRPNSSDSREWGFVPKEDLIGRVVLEAYPVKAAGVVGHLSYPSL